MSKDNKKYFFVGLFGALCWPIIDGILLYLGVDATGLLLSLLETVFG